MFIWWMDCSQIIKDLLLDKLSVFQGRTYSCYSGKPWTYLKQGWYCKVWQSIILWYMDLLTLSYHICSMPRGLQRNSKVNGNVKQPNESLIGQCEHNTFETPWDKLQNLLGMTLAILAILVIDLPIQLKWISKKWETMVCWKSLFSKWTAVREEKTYYLINLVFSEKKMDSYYSVPTPGNPWTYVKKGWCYKVWQPIMTWYMNLLTFSYPLRYASRCCLWPPYPHLEMFCNKLRTLLSFLYVYSIHCVKLLSKHLEANFKHLLGMEFANDVIFLVLSSVNNDLIIYVFDTGADC